MTTATISYQTTHSLQQQQKPNTHTVSTHKKRGDNGGEKCSPTQELSYLVLSARAARDNARRGTGMLIVLAVLPCQLVRLKLIEICN